MRVVNLSVRTLILLSAGCALLTKLWAQQPARPAVAAPRTAAAAPVAASTPPSREADEKAIRQTADSFSKAYNDHDAEAIANLFTADGELVDPAGDAQQGRAAIRAVFSAVFDQYPEATTSVTIGSVRFLSSNLAVEDGVANVVHEPDTAAEANKYTAIHIKQDGKWLMASARDLPDAPLAAAEELKQLAGLIGDWVDESPDSLIVTNYQWTDNQCYILSNFSVQSQGKALMTGSQRIGWDPQARVIRTWVFDSEGGFGTGVYNRDGDRWIIKMTSVTRDGEQASATNTLRILSADRLSWESRDRMEGGLAQPDIEPVIVVRKPPQPE